jgi:LDH2 family malate/lactate/ureidoglycolate dehydrogenase
MTLEEVRDLTESTLTRLGLDARQVAAVAATIVAGERDGCAAHGLYRLLVCAHTIRTGKVARNVTPVIHDVARALVRVDCQGGFAQIGYEAAAPLLVEKAKACGLAALGLNNCVHFAALWPEIEALTAHGLVAFAFTPSHAWVAPAGGTTPVFGTNPIAFGWPRPGRDPFVFDLATSATARGEIELHRRAGRPIPLGWGLDSEGRPTTDAAEALAGAMLTFGGHKGSALAAMVELIAGPLIGDMTSAESLAADGGAGASPIGGELIIAIDPGGFLGDTAAEHLARAEQVFASITGQGARLPSERRYTARATSLAEGVEVPVGLIKDIAALFDADSIPGGPDA